MKFDKLLYLTLLCRAVNGQAAGNAAAMDDAGAVLGDIAAASTSSSSLDESATATESESASATATATDVNTEDVTEISASVDADNDLSIVGTWSSKSNQVFTGPGFYDPIDELLIEPSLPGISYSFSSDGWFEEATYQVSGNPKDPKCPTAAITFQHGHYKFYSNGSLILNPINSDGRQLVSDPCNDDGVSTYSRYAQQEIMRNYLVVFDDYHGIYKLLLWEFDGTPMQPLYLAYKPPMMLPKETLNPVDTSNSNSIIESDSPDATASTSGAAMAKRDSINKLVKRGLENRYKTNAIKNNNNSNKFNLVWYISATFIGLGSLLFLFM